MKPAPRSGFWWPERLASRLAGKAGAVWADQRGVAAIEFGMFFILLSASLANVADVSKYIFQRMEVENATEVAAQAAFAACGQPQQSRSPQLPATTNCSNLMVAVNAALQSTSLGTAVQLVNNPPVGGLLLHQFGQRPAKCRCCYLAEAFRLHGRGHADIGARRLYPDTNPIYLSTVVSGLQRRQLFPGTHQPNSHDAIGLTRAESSQIPVSEPEKPPPRSNSQSSHRCSSCWCSARSDWPSCSIWSAAFTLPWKTARAALPSEDPGNARIQRRPSPTPKAVTWVRTSRRPLPMLTSQPAAPRGMAAAR